jgi:hypothetical protein
MMLKESVWIFTIAAVGGPTGRLNVCDTIWLRTKNPKKSLRVHRPRANLNVVGLLDHTAAVAPVMLKLKN